MIAPAPPSASRWQLDRDFARFEHRCTVDHGRRPIEIVHPVFHAGKGPALLVMHELPGLVQPCIDFAGRLVERGFHVFLPHLVGPLLREATLGNAVRLCISREFAHLQAGVSAPVTRWLRALAARIAAEWQQPRIGAVGMCLTGAFVIPLLLEDVVRAAVGSQPSVPFGLRRILLGPAHGGGAWEHRLNVSRRDLHAAAAVARNDGKAVLFQRFEADPLCPRARLDRLAKAFGDPARIVHHGTSPLRGGTRRPPHALLTEEYDRSHRGDAPVPADDPTERALAELVALFDAHLREPDLRRSA